ncbi:MAG: VWA domain-containing protein [Betaproteobacteria bacterium]|nr:VWA domain-containing protein [Betaproteobacteria bacterium]
MNTPFSPLTITLTPRRPALVAGFENQIDVLVRIQAPAAPEGFDKKRPPYGIGLVIDRSGSMSGQPLEEAKRCAAHVVQALSPEDTVALVAFDNRVKTLATAQPRADGRALALAIESLNSGGNTDLHGGWLAGAEQLAQAAVEAGLKRVILLSDGCANEGITTTPEIADACRTMAARGITTSTYGLGHHFNEELMVAMAEAGQGNHYYGETAEDLMEPFQTEFDLLANLCCKGLKLRAEAGNGIAVEMLNQVPGDAHGGWQLTDLAWGSEAWALLRLRVPMERLPAEGGEVLLNLLDLLQVTLAVTDLEGCGHVFHSPMLSLPAVNSAAYSALAEDLLVLRRMAEVDAGKLLRDTREAAKRGDWAEVDRILKQAETDFAGNEYVAGVLASIRGVAESRQRERFMKDALYASAGFNKRLAMADECLDFAAEMEAPSFLRRKRAPGKEEFGKKQ